MSATAPAPAPTRRRRTLKARAAEAPATEVPAPEAPVLSLPPVVLGAPVGDSSRTPSMAGRAFLSVALLAGVFVLAAAVVLGLVLANLLAWQAGRVIGALVIATIAVVAALGRALLSLVKRPPDSPFEVEISEADDPGLWAEVRGLADQVGTRPPDRIVVVAEVNAYVHEQGAFLGLAGGTRTLAIGTPLLEVLTVSQLRSVLGHELGHLAGGDTRLGPLAYRTEAALAAVVRSLGNRATAAIFLAYWKLQHRVSATVRRGQELTADRASVKVAGRQAAADALNALPAASAAHDGYVESYLVPLLEQSHWPDDVAGGFRAFVSGRHDRLVEITAAQAEQPVEVDPYASHPPIPERIRRVEALPDVAEIETDERSARALLAEPERWAEAAHRRWAEVVTSGVVLASVPWESFGQVVAERHAGAAATDVDQVLTALGHTQDLAGLEAALAEGKERELAAGLVGAGWRGGSGNVDLLRHAIRALAVREAVTEHGATWVTSWTGPLELRDAKGAPLDLDALTAQAAEGEWGPLARALPTDRPRSRRNGPRAKAAAPVPASVAPVEPHGDRWLVRLPGRLGSKVTIGTTPTAMVLGDQEVPYDEMAHVTLSLGAANDNGLNVTYTVETLAGRSVKARTSVMTNKGGESLLEAADHVWKVWRAAVAPRLRAAAVEAVLAGTPTEVGGLRLTREGVALVKKPAKVIAWATLADPVIDGRTIAMVSNSSTVRTQLSSKDAVVLMDLIPELRAHLA